MAASDLRVEESLRRLSAQRDEVCEWSEHWRRRDQRKQFHTQLTSLETTLVGALTRLSAVAAELTPRSAPEAHEICRNFDHELLTIRRLWRWFADKFDQREDPRQERVLSAADEVVWSIYAGMMRAANGGKVPSPAPLPYLDDLTTPEAVPRDDPPPDLRPDSFDEGLQLMLSKLPIPVVGLPAGIRDEPWQLALLGHEVGHHLQYDLLPGRALVKSVGVAVASAAGGGPGGDDWRSWSREIFADLAGLVTLGPASLVALLPLELGTETYMLDRGRGRYPAPTVRLGLIRAMARELGLHIDDPVGESTETPRAGPQPPTPGDYPTAARAAIDADLALVPCIARTLIAYPVADKRTLAQLSALPVKDFAPGGSISVYARQLRTGDGVIKHGLHRIRALVSAGMVAWQQVGAIDDPSKRSEALRALGNTLTGRIIASAEEDTRAAGEQCGAAVAVDADLAQILARRFTR
jgi:hypothetical protein